MDHMTPPSALRPTLQIVDVQRSYKQGSRDVPVLQGASADLWPGQSVALVGPSGAGKSTLLHIAGLLESPTGGSVLLNGQDCAALSDSERTRLRRRSIGFVYQFHQLLPEFSALENVVIPQMIMGKRRKLAEAHALELLTALGLGPRVHHRPAELSGGEQQRTAICRGVANSPHLLLADEPTGNLDPHTSEFVFQELVELIRHRGVAALIATHNMDLARRMDRVLYLAEGRLHEMSPAGIR
jgi:lipoprotein-releasing system ATP-binding protein